MVDHNLLLEFNSIFPDEDYSIYLNKIKEIPSSYIIDFSTSFLRYQINDERISDPLNLLSLWFREENNDYANTLYKSILSYQEASRVKVIIINEVTNLLILEAGLENDVKEIEITDAEFEILFFKIYIAYNQKSVCNERLAGTTTERFDMPYRINALLVAHSLNSSDITEYNLYDSFIIQLAKVIYFFEEFTVNEGFKALLESFYKYYKVTDYKDFVKQYLELSSQVLKSRDSGMIDITIPDIENRGKANDFLEKFVIPTNCEDDIDFKLVRSQPLIKVGEYKFRIISPLFVIEKLYNGLYFKLKELNDQMSKEEKVKDLRSEITHKYSEQKLLYTLLRRCYNERFIQHSGESIEKHGISGFVDYYIRNGNKVFIFESKDILINAAVKQSYDFNAIEKELIKKLYYEEEKGKVVPKAVLQLINSIKILLDNKFTLDGNYRSNSIRIYPVIVLHNSQLEILGLNQIVKTWFRNELTKLGTESYKIAKIKDVIILNVDTLICYSDQINSNKIRLEDAIESYLDSTNQELARRIRFRDEQHRSSYMRNTCLSFSEYFRRTYKWKLPKIFLEKGHTLFSE